MVERREGGWVVERREGGWKGGTETILPSQGKISDTYCIQCTRLSF